jgi:putative two-component system response regulator
MLDINKALRGSQVRNIQTDQTDDCSELHEKIFALEKENADITLQLQRYAIDFKDLYSHREDSSDLLSKAHIDSLGRLAKASEYKDDDTGIHILRMAKIAEAIASAHGQDDVYCKLILQASPMHDIGKIGIPDSILKKKGGLSDSEWKIMQKHPEFGYEILRGSVVPVIDMAAEIALSHHEKYDGSGYPYGLVGDEIPLCGQIVAIADFFDALTMDRCYRKAIPDSDVLVLIDNERDKHFSPELVDTFLAISNEVIELRNFINAISTI